MDNTIYQLLIDDLSELEDDELKAIHEILNEYRKAREKHPNWPTDIIHAGAIVAEEAGELTRATLHEVYEEGSLDDTAEEAIQTGAMAMRFLIQTVY